VYFIAVLFFFFFSSSRRHTRFSRDWSSDVCSSDLSDRGVGGTRGARARLKYNCLSGGGEVVETGDNAVIVVTVRNHDRPVGWGGCTRTGSNGNRKPR